MTEFNLSEELTRIWNNTSVSGEGLILSSRTELADKINDRVKEFIKLEDDLLNLLYQGKITWTEFLSRRLKLAGEKLTT